NYRVFPIWYVFFVSDLGGSGTSWCCHGHHLAETRKNITGASHPLNPELGRLPGCCTAFSCPFPLWPFHHPDPARTTGERRGGRRQARAKGRGAPHLPKQRGRTPGARSPALPAPACTHRAHVGFPLPGSHGSVGSSLGLGGDLLPRAGTAERRGTPRNCLPLPRIIDEACHEAEIYKDAGIDGLIVENMHDLPYTTSVGPEITAAMTIISAAVKQTCPQLPLGIQILCSANQQAVAVALAAGLDFIRAEGFVFSHVADEGIINACAGDLLRYRKQIGAEHIQIFADIKKKHR
uniref:Uncharacterized protein n=1 Tax=Crocodylus porosus TaxID=8502 RepID=A0A7M4E8N1_CROPO